MKSKKNIKSILVMAIICIISLFFINMSLAANTAKISVETANLRQEPNEDSKILELLSLNDEVEVLEKQENWYKVKAKGITGYLREDLITLDQNEIEEAKNNTANTQEEASNETQNQTQTTNNQPEQTVETTSQEIQETSTSNQNEITIGKQIVAKDSKLKIVPAINATDIIEVKKDEEVTVTEIINGWASIETNTTKGWIRKENLKTLEQKQQEEQANKQEQENQTQETIKTLYINSQTVNLRKEANTSSEVIAKLSVNTAVQVLSEENGWSKVKVEDKEGYISSSLLSETKQETSRSSSTPRNVTKNENKETVVQEKEEQTNNSSAQTSGATVVEYAKKFIGVKYKYGGSSPSTGFDCSGFTKYVYSHFGVSLPRTSSAQGKVGTAVSKSNLALGDLVVYSGHVAIYVGGGNVIHAPRPGKTVCIVPLNQAASNYIGARRVL